MNWLHLSDTCSFYDKNTTTAKLWSTPVNTQYRQVLKCKKLVLLLSQEKNCIGTSLLFNPPNLKIPSSYSESGLRSEIFIHVPFWSMISAYNLSTVSERHCVNKFSQHFSPFQEDFWWISGLLPEIRPVFAGFCLKIHTDDASSCLVAWQELWHAIASLTVSCFFLGYA